MHSSGELNLCVSFTEPLTVFQPLTPPAVVRAEAGSGESIETLQGLHKHVGLSHTYAAIIRQLCA